MAAGAYELAAFSIDDAGVAHDLIGRYHDLGIGLADASIVILAERLGTDLVLTLDERRFKTLTTEDGKPFTLLPADA